MAIALKSPTLRALPRDRQSAVRHRPPLRSVKGGARPSQQQRQRPVRSPLSAVPALSPRPVVRRLPTSRPLPFWLSLLIYIQRGSLAVAFVLVTAALVVYGSTIYMQQLWSKEYGKLKMMQRSERQMIAVGEGLKNQLIQQAEQPGSGLVPKLQNTPFL